MASSDKLSLPSWKKSISVLVTGLVGSGKSSLINSLLGRKEAKEKHSPFRETQTVRVYHHKSAEGLCVELWDSPGLGRDYENCMEGIKARHCDNVDLVFFCINMYGRFREADKESVKWLTNGLRKDIWNRTIFVLTFANRVADRLEQSGHKFNQLLEDWQERLAVAVQEVGVDKDSIASCIPVVPAGCVERVELPSVCNWQKSLWTTAISRVLEQPKSKDVSSKVESSVLAAGAILGGVLGAGVVILPVLAVAAAAVAAATTLAVVTVADGGDFYYYMRPDELAKWLHSTYGRAYRDDISKLEGAKINGKLFLELLENKEKLEELELSYPFKKLILKKITELRPH